MAKTRKNNWEMKSKKKVVWKKKRTLSDIKHKQRKQQLYYEGE